MTNKYFMFNILAIREVQIKPVLNPILTLSEWIKEMIRMWSKKGSEDRGIFAHCWQECQTCAAPLGISEAVFQKLKVKYPMDQLSHSWVCMQTTLSQSTTGIPAYSCSLPYWSQYPDKGPINLYEHWQKRRYRWNDTYSRWNLFTHK